MSQRFAPPWIELADAAETARDLAYAPYSSYKVGAALLARKRNEGVLVYRGVNIENASYGLCLCAERSAVANAVTDGVRDFLAIAIATEGPTPGAPCGMCRQVLAEFAPRLPVALVVGGRVRRKTTIADLLPGAFTGAVLRGRKKARR